MPLKSLNLDAYSWGYAQIFGRRSRLHCCFPLFSSDPDAITLSSSFSTRGANVWKSGLYALRLVSICGFSASSGSLQRGFLLSLSSDCYMFCVCVHSPDFTLITFTNLIFIAFKLLTTLRTMLVLSVGVRLGQIKVVSHFRTTKIFQFFKVFIEQSTLWSNG